jgi:hypothetical protein
MRLFQRCVVKLALIFENTAQFCMLPLGRE